jgi:hypothetical protein
MDSYSEGGPEGMDLPPGCWHSVMEHLGAVELARAAGVNRTCRTVCVDDRLWSGAFKRAWSPEVSENPPECASRYLHALYGPGRSPSTVPNFFFNYCIYDTFMGVFKVAYVLTAT